jgi:hypothetical protein
MTGNIRNGFGLLVVAVMLWLVFLLFRGSELENVATVAALAAILLAFTGLYRVATALLKPERD